MRADGLDDLVAEAPQAYADGEHAEEQHVDGSGGVLEKFHSYFSDYPYYAEALWIVSFRARRAIMIE